MQPPPGTIHALSKALGSGKTLAVTFRIIDSDVTVELSFEGSRLGASHPLAETLYPEILKALGVGLESFEDAKMVGDGAIVVEEDNLVFAFTSQNWVLGRDDLGWLDDGTWEDREVLCSANVDTELVNRIRKLVSNGETITVEWEFPGDAVSRVYSENDATDWTDGRDDWYWEVCDRLTNALARFSEDELAPYAKGKIVERGGSLVLVLSPGDCDVSQIRFYP